MLGLTFVDAFACSCASFSLLAWAECGADKTHNTVYTNFNNRMAKFKGYKTR